MGGSTHFDADDAFVDVISEEEVVGRGGMTTDLEQFHEIILRYGKLADMEIWLIEDKVLTY